MSAIIHFHNYYIRRPTWQFYRLISSEGADSNQGTKSDTGSKKGDNVAFMGDATTALKVEDSMSWS
jgi:hypothetical protein